MMASSINVQFSELLKFTPINFVFIYLLMLCDIILGNHIQCFKQLPVEPELYYDRKQNRSTNVMAVSDDSKEIV